MWLVIRNRVLFDKKVFYEGVSWEFYRKVGFTKDESELLKEYNKYEDYIGLPWDEFKAINVPGFEIVIDKNVYIISKDDAIETMHFTRSENIPAADYRYKKQEDDTKDYTKAYLELMGIDITINYAPQFRDGVNPMKDGGSKA